MVSVASGCEHGWVPRPVLSAILPECLPGAGWGSGRGLWLEVS